MKVGYGCTVWANGARAGHQDGIGIYTGALWKGLSELSQSAIDLQPYAFGRDWPSIPCGVPRRLAKNFPMHALLSGSLGVTLPCSKAIASSVNLFHATDHLIPNIAGVPTVATIMDLIPLLHPEWIKSNLRPLKSWLFKQSILKADHIITISQHSRQDLIQHLNIAPERISVTPLGVDPAYFQRVDSKQREMVLKKHQLPQGFFLFIGTLQPRKNLLRTLQAFKELPANVRRDHPLVIVGRDGWNNGDLLPQLEALEQAGEGRWLRYLPQTDVFALLQSARALVFPSLYEGFGLPLVEAFAAQCPVIASNSSSLREVAADAAWEINPHSVDSIHAAMRAVLTDAALRKRKVHSGLQRARQYTWHECARQTLDVYTKVLG